MSDVPEPPPEPAERRAMELLQLVGGQMPPVSDRYTPELVGRARRQLAVAVPLRAVGGLLAALAAALFGAIRSDRREDRP